MASLDQRRRRAIQLIESLRSGVPTRLSTRELPDLRPELANLIRADLKLLADGLPAQGRLVWGQYGQGKSHLLIAAGHLALEMGFAVSYVSFSREVSCHDLFHFYQRVAPAVRTPHSKVPGLQLQLARISPADFERSNIVEPDRYCHRLPAVVLELLLRSGADREECYDLYSDLMGNRLPIAEVRRMARGLGAEDLLRELSRFKREHAPAYFGTLADTVRLCGCKGWVILADELELIARLGRVSRLNAYRNLLWLLNWGDEMTYPLYFLGAAAASLQDAWYRRDGRRLPDRDGIPEVAESRCGNAVSRQLVDFFERARSPSNPVVTPLARERVYPLLERLVVLHGVAHGWEPPPPTEWVRRVTQGLAEDTKLRTYIRFVLEALDLLLLTGQTPDLRAGMLAEPSVGEEIEEDDQLVEGL